MGDEIIMSDCYIINTHNNNSVGSHYFFICSYIKHMNNMCCNKLSKNGKTYRR